jgi:predicted Zn-dependent protease
MLARVLVLVAAIGAVAFGATRLHRTDRCNDAHFALLFGLAHHQAPPHGLSVQLHTLSTTCDDPVQLEGISILLTASGRYTRAQTLARRAIAVEPQDQAGWVALAQVLDRTDPAGAARARARVHQLDPKGVVLQAPRHITVLH